MKLFKRYFAILDGYEFATPQDRENALWAAFWASQAGCALALDLAPFRPPLVVIDGPRGSGKSRLATQLCKAAGWLPAPADSISIKRLNSAAACYSSVIWFDDARLNRAATAALESFVVAKKWMFRSFRSEVMRTVDLNCLTILSGAEVNISADLETRAVHIRLLHRRAQGVDWRKEMEGRVLYASGTLKPICSEPGARRFLVAGKKKGGVKSCK